MRNLYKSLVNNNNNNRFVGLISCCRFAFANLNSSCKYEPPSLFPNPSPPPPPPNQPLLLPLPPTHTSTFHRGTPSWIYPYFRGRCGHSEPPRPPPPTRLLCCVLHAELSQNKECLQQPPGCERLMRALVVQRAGGRLPPLL